MKTPDITYKDHGLFTALQFIVSLRKAGYVVQKAKESKQSLDEIFAELDE